MPTARDTTPFLSLLLAGIAFGIALPAISLVMLLALPVEATERRTTPAVNEWCDDTRLGRNDHCEVRALSARTSGDAFRASEVRNGSISVEGWDGSEVRIVARVLARNAGSAGEAAEMVDDVVLEAGTGELRISGPRTGFLRRASWTVDLRMQVPRGTALTLGATNGSIRVEDIGGAVDARTTNGSVTIDGVAGIVRARSTNGAVRVGVAGGEGVERVDVSTTNGSVELTLPASVSARVDASTRNGRVTSDFALETEGRRQNRASGVLGEGRGEITLRTTNGSIRIRSGR